MKWVQVSGAVVFAFLLLSPVVTTTCAASDIQDDAQASAVPNIQVAEVLTSVFDELLSVSPSFMAQCERIASARYVHVVVQPVLSSSVVTRGSARSRMRRFASGALLASVDMPVPLTSFEYAELFGHEFEHIIEQIDRVNLESLTINHGGATRLADGAYETTRARRAGRVIADESERPRSARLPTAAPTGSVVPVFRFPAGTR
jgi:hypothetical protein